MSLVWENSARWDGSVSCTQVRDCKSRESELSTRHARISFALLLTVGLK